MSAKGKPGLVDPVELVRSVASEADLRLNEPVEESPEERKARLTAVLQQLDAAPGSVFLDLCELVLLLSERTEMMLKWNHPRALVHIKHKPRPVAPKARRSGGPSGRRPAGRAGPKGPKDSGAP